MSTRWARAVLALLSVLVLAIGVAACGEDDEGGGGGGGGGAEGGGGKPAELIQADPANKGKTITIGSKNFDEQYILGEIYAQALEAAGFKVKKSLDLGSEQIAFKAVKGGDVDAYPEYLGTALTNFYGVKTEDIPDDATQAYEQLKEKARKDKLTVLPQTPFQNTYVVTSTKKTWEELGRPRTISDLADKAKGKKLSGFPECKQRTDCLIGLKTTYGWQPKFVSSEGKYTDLNEGQADFTMGFGTDGQQLLTDKYAFYEDDKQLFPPYYISLIVRDQAIEKLGQSGQDVITSVQEQMTEENMKELNSRVSIDKEEPEAAARAYLRESGYIK